MTLFVSRDDMTAGLYIHIPFCPQICGYCDFYKLAHRGDAQVESYLAALRKEISLYATHSSFRGLKFGTLYFGGGTPSILNAAHIHEMVELAFSNFQFEPTSEVTLETDPGTADVNKLRDFRAAGVNRLSLGIQSFQNHELKFLDRTHTAEDAIATFEMSRQAGFENISIDLIFALPSQRRLEWEENLSQAIRLAPNHISTYCLTYEDRTPLMFKLRKGLVEKLPDEKQREMYLQALEFLAANGFDHYEVSNFAKAGFYSRHNLKYWDGSAYLGLGASAHSFIGERRFWNFSHLKKYRDALAADRLPIEAEEQLTHEQEILERIFLSLRQRKGLDVKSFEASNGVAFFERYRQPLLKFFDGELPEAGLNGAAPLKSDLLEFDGQYLKLTDAGFAVCDAVCAEFQ
jgi:oxygen-independent coproporphyrinogen-3 oxidase